MSDFKDAEKLLEETKTKFESGDYNATIDLATEAINVGTMALNTFYEMGLSFAIKSSEKLVANLKEMDIDVSSVEEIITSAKNSVENKEYESTEDIIKDLKTSISELSQKMGDKISELVSTAQTKIDGAKEIGADVKEAEEKLRAANSEIESGAYQTALGLINSSESLVESAKKKRISEISDIISASEKAIEEAKFVNAPVTEAEDLLGEAKSANEDQNYPLAIEKATSATESANASKEEQIKRVMALQEQMKAPEASAASSEAAVEQPQEVPLEEPSAEPEATFEEAPAGDSASIEKACPKCGGEPSFVEQYDKYFCYTCNEYTEPEEKKAEEPKEEGDKACPKCDGDATYVEQYDKYFCYTCNEYVVPKEKEAGVKEEAVVKSASAKVCPTCSGEPTFVEQYNRYFCYTCNEYVEPVEGKAEEKAAPKAEVAKVCPKCEGEPTYVEQYDKYFCYTCNEYVQPKEGKAEVKTQPAAVKAEKVCPKCEGEPTYVEQYKKYFCYTCNEYVVPKDKAAASKNACPTCGQEATYVDQYKRYYCYTCNNYV
jgi:ribosomal protein S27AE/uncharacterized protein (UPF0332 family)